MTFTGLDLLKHLEACRLRAYADRCKSRKDPQHVCIPSCEGVWTIGYGHTGPEVKPNTVWTQERAEEQLAEDVQRFVFGVTAAVSGEPLSDNQFSALVIFAFNVGLMAFRGSSALRSLRLGQLSQVPADMAKWDKVHDSSGVLVEDPILVARRKAEANLWRTS